MISPCSVESGIAGYIAIVLPALFVRRLLGVEAAEVEFENLFYAKISWFLPGRH